MRMSYDAHTSEGNGILSVTCGRRPAHLVTMFSIAKEISVQTRKQKLYLRTVRASIFSGLILDPRLSRKEHFNPFMFPTAPFLHKFPCVGIHSTDDICTRFRFEPLHCLSPGLSKTLKKCLFPYCPEAEIYLSGLKYHSGERKLFQEIRKLALMPQGIFAPNR